MENIRLSDNFMLSELVKSSTADRLGIDNWPTDENHLEALKAVTQNILQPVREHFGIPFAPNSGYRCPALNEAVGSKPTSQHAKGQAVDLELPGVSNYDLACWIRDNLSFDQLILECYKSGQPSSGWVHCSYVNDDANRNQSLTYHRDTGFVTGLVE